MTTTVTAAFAVIAVSLSACTSPRMIYIQDPATHRLYGPMAIPSHCRVSPPRGTYTLIYAKEVSPDDMEITALLREVTLPDFSLRNAPTTELVKRMRASVPQRDGQPAIEIRIGPCPREIEPPTWSGRCPHFSLEDMLTVITYDTNLKYRFEGRTLTFYTE